MNTSTNNEKTDANQARKHDGNYIRYTALNIPR